jgi:hypothetical protein
VAEGASELPSDRLVDLLDEIGTGLSGDDYNEQLELIGSPITAASFSDW